jgi:hypothetical protein
VQSLNTQGWGVYRDVPYFTGDEWNGDFYFSNGDSIVYLHTGNVDGTDLDGENSNDIEFSMLTAFHDPGPQGMFKRGQYIRPSFISEGTPGFSASARYDYRLNEGDTAVPPSANLESSWDVAVWDSDMWGGQLTITDYPVGAMDYGIVVAVAIRGSTNFETTLIGMDYMYDSGGLM